jgi:hemerythrin-like domain-containing protein
MKSTKFLMQEHKLILRALDVIDNMAAWAEKNGALDEVDIGDILDFLRWFADAHHQAKEDTILFPALKRAAAAQGRAVDHMMLEHEQERALIEQIETSVRLAKIQEFIGYANRLSSTLRNHIYKEDDILFEFTKTALNPEIDDSVVGQLEKFDTAFDKEVLAEKISRLRALEWKYLRRTS